ncbi:MAG: DUF882 domain-containing protein [Steroidobacteraceae bacterium]
MSSRESRRRFLRGTLSGLAVGFLPISSHAQTIERRRLVLINSHTGEMLDTIYWANGAYQPAEMGRLDWAFRDHRTSNVRPIDSRLFDLLHELAMTAGLEPRYQIISGFRSPATNAMLAAASDGVSSRSLHMEGRAIDVRLEGLPLASLRDLALAKRAGGVGYYPKSDFVHLDVGRVRSWQ